MERYQPSDAEELNALNKMSSAQRGESNERGTAFAKLSERQRELMENCDLRFKSQGEGGTISGKIKGHDVFIVKTGAGSWGEDSTIDGNSVGVTDLQDLSSLWNNYEDIAALQTIDSEQKAFEATDGFTISKAFHDML